MKHLKATWPEFSLQCMKQVGGPHHRKEGGGSEILMEKSSGRIPGKNIEFCHYSNL